MKKDKALNSIILESPSPSKVLYFVQSFDEIAPLVLDKKEIKKFSIFAVCRYYLILEEGATHH